MTSLPLCRQRYTKHTGLYTFPLSVPRGPLQPNYSIWVYHSITWRQSQSPFEREWQGGKSWSICLWALNHLFFLETISKPFFPPQPSAEYWLGLFPVVKLSWRKRWFKPASTGIYHVRIGKGGRSPRSLFPILLCPLRMATQEPANYYQTFRLSWNHHHLRRDLMFHKGNRLDPFRHQTGMRQATEMEMGAREVSFVFCTRPCRKTSFLLSATVFKV